MGGEAIGVLRSTVVWSVVGIFLMFYFFVGTGRLFFFYSFLVFIVVDGENRFACFLDVLDKWSC